MMMQNRIAAHLQQPQQPLQQPITALKGTAIWVTARRSQRARSRWHVLLCAVRGLRDAWLTQPNLRIHTVFGISAVILGGWVHLGLTEWLWISVAIGLVVFAELMNTAIEQTVDLVIGPRPDPLARQVKDIAAGFVLVTAVTAVAIGCFTFLPHLVARG